MISQIANKHADKCRFCWMCRHLCPVQLQTGKEVNTPRAKGLLLSMIARGETYDKDMAKAMYECFLCDACTNDCATGYEPPLFIREARTEAVVQDLEPEEVMKLIDREEEKGSIYEEDAVVFDAPEKGKILVYAGEAAVHKTPDMVKALLNIQKKAGISYMVLKDEPTSGAMLGDLMGYVDEVRQQAVKCAEAINNSGAEEVVVLDSYDEQIMKQKYPEWECEIKTPVTGASVYIAGLLKEGRISVKKQAEGLAAYHDDDRAARTFHEFESGRDIAKAAGYKLTEMFNHLELAKSCGNSLTLAYMPEITEKAAKGRWDDLLRTKAEIMLTASPQSLECLQRTIPQGKQLKDIYTVLDECC